MSVSLDQTSGDPTARVMETLRLAGAVFSLADLSAPWGVAAGEQETGIFHAVIRGSCWARLDGEGRPERLNEGQVVWFPHGSRHLMLDAPDSPVTPVRQQVTSEGDLSLLRIQGGGDETTLLCGTVRFDESALHPMLSVLPPLVVVGGSEDPHSGWISSTVDLMRQELSAPRAGSAAVLTRLADVMVLYAVRSLVSRGDLDAGWIGALRDPPVGEALALIHEHPERPWTVHTLAAAVGLSRSTFYARFAATVGEPPATYLARWRLHLAARLLSRGGSTVASIARRVGYADDAALNRAFKRWTGVTPGRYRQEWRQDRQSPAATELSP